jgi:hypothetical protein
MYPYSTANLKNFTWNWNETNYTFYDDSLLLMLNFDNRSSLGENDSFVRDLSTYGHHATCSGTSCPNWSEDGRFGGAFYYDNVNDHFAIESNDLLKVSTFTLALWINPSLINDTAFFFGNSNPSSSPWCGWSMGKNRGALSCNDGDICIWISECSGTRYEYIDYPYEFPTDTWTHFAVTFDNNNRNLVYYINGEVLYSTTTAFNIGFDEETITTISSSNYPFGGGLDEFLLWNRTLSVEEIQELYKSNFYKYNETQWYFTNNKTGIDKGIYTYYGYAESDLEHNQTETRTLEILDDSLNIFFTDSNA